ncbi:uncharacterized protein BYT42DRAFT_609819 [Radiomyces spectabilis]|uniref:uncharacterized protein n=1 Tax=Radiomyces spectabilis TaxID=64574 RepID=UPI0022210788|nr:uncharacterized protein BYT42DRAFT_609819 [Radiomyces spectabilis]KAI8394067.1 hypothetical protein BYT42DRAFT_609819 [Radiomyces spectabilis]
MTKDELSDDEPWRSLDPDPGAFTQLCLRMGVRGVQVERLHSMKRDSLRTLKPVYGVILLVRQKTDLSLKDEPSTSNGPIYFANQVVHWAYAMHALLSVLLNCDEIEIGADLAHFKHFTRDFSPMMKGLSLTNCDKLKKAQNSLSNFHSSSLDDKIYHHISYIYNSGHLWELDGFKRGPVKLGLCTDDNWLEVARTELLRKVELYQRQHIPYSIWSVMEDRRRVLQRRLIAKQYIQTVIERQLDEHHPSWRMLMRVQQWQDEYAHAMNNANNKRGQDASTYLLNTYCRSIHDMPKDEQNAMHSQLETEVKNRPMDELTTLWLKIQDDTLRLYEQLGQEDEKEENYKHDVVRRNHDYKPFITSLIDSLVAQGYLQQMLADAS